MEGSNVVEKYVLLLCCVGGLLAADQRVVNGWTKARWGMTEAQVLSAFPGEATRLTSELPERTFDGRVSTIGIESVTIEGTRFTAFFFFDQRKALDKVLLQTTEVSGPALSLIHQRVENALVSKYGQRPHVTKAGSDSIVISGVWTLVGTNIELQSIIGDRFISDTLSIVYTKRAVENPRL